MARRVFLHVGTMKSATSYLQALCDCNVDLLAGHGVLWAWSRDNFLAVHDLLGTAVERPGLEGAWAAMKQRLDAHHADALISNELLSTLTPAKLATLVEALAPAEAHVIITARDLARTIPSQWQTRLRNGDTITLADYVAALADETDAASARKFWRRHDVAGIIARVNQVVPVDRMCIVTVPPSGSDFTIVARRFASVIGVPADELTQPPVANPSLGAFSAELMRRLNSRVGELDTATYRAGFREVMAGQVLTAHVGDEPPIQLPTARAAWVHERSKQMVAGVVATGVRVVGDLDDLVSADPASTRRDARPGGRQTQDTQAGDTQLGDAWPGDAQPGDAQPEVPGQEPKRPKPDDQQLLDLALSALAALGRISGGIRIEHELLIDVVEATLSVDERELMTLQRNREYREDATGTRDALVERGRLLRSLITERGA